MGYWCWWLHAITVLRSCDGEIPMFFAMENRTGMPFSAAFCLGIWSWAKDDQNQLISTVRTRGPPTIRWARWVHPKWSMVADSTTEALSSQVWRLEALGLMSILHYAIYTPSFPVSVCWWNKINALDRCWWLHQLELWAMNIEIMIKWSLTLNSGLFPTEPWKFPVLTKCR